jgi:2-dehydropantoate 2-reductase
MADNPSPLIIVGTGAMACLFAARLSAAGVPFSMLGSWPEGVAALRQGGVRVTEQDGKQKTYPVHVVTEPSACAGARFALVLVKSWQTEHSAQQLSQCLEEQGLALTLQNGMGNREKLALALGSQRVALGVTTAGAYLLGPGHVRPAGEGVITLGLHSHMKPLADILRAAGFIVESASDTNILLWGKLVINAAINPLTALLRIPNGELLTRPPARALLSSVARESAAVAVAKGVDLPYPDPVVATESIASRTANNYSSMLQDVLRGAPTEVDAISGAIVQASEQTGVPAPINRTLWQLVKALNPQKTGQL